MGLTIKGKHFRNEKKHKLIRERLMEKEERKMKKLITGGLFIFILFGFSSGSVWANPPIVVSKSPNHGASNVLINIQITVQFNMTMNTNNTW